MKRLRRIRRAAVVVAALLIGITGVLSAQSQMPAPTPVPAPVPAPLQGSTGTSISAKPGQRTAKNLPAPDKEGIHLSLDEAIRAALANNVDLNITVDTAEAAQFGLFQNTGIYDPLLSANATRASSRLPVSTVLSGTDIDVSRSDTVNAGVQVSQLTPWGGTYSLGYGGNRAVSNSSFATVNPGVGAGLTLGVSQPLLRNFGVRATNLRIDIARFTRDESYLSFVRTVQTTIDLVEQAYWDLVYARANLLVKQEARQIAGELNRITKIKIDVGSLAPIDIVQTEVGIATAEQDIITAEAAVGFSGDQLRRLLNFEATSGQTPIVPTDEIRVERQAFELADGVRTALDRRPEIRAQGYVVAADKITFDYWHNQLLPQLDLVGNYGRNGLAGKSVDANGVVTNTNFWDASNQIFTENFRTWSVGFLFSYPLFNRTARGAKGVAEYNLEAEKSRLTTLQQDVVVNVRNAHRAIETASRQIDAAAKGRELAERNLDAARKKYDNGMTTSFEVSQIQAQLSDAKSKELQALAIYRKAVSAYHSAVADILDWKGVHIEDMPELSPSDVGANAELVRRAVEGTLGAP